MEIISSLFDRYYNLTNYNTCICIIFIYCFRGIMLPCHVRKRLNRSSISERQTGYRSFITNVVIVYTVKSPKHNYGSIYRICEKYPLNGTHQ